MSAEQQTYVTRVGIFKLIGYRQNILSASLFNST